MSVYKTIRRGLLGLPLAFAISLPTNAATESKVIEVKGEIIDTWCYFSGVMGGPDAVTGTAHHTCALWCAAGGIPIGMRTEDGKVFMVLKIKGHQPLEPTDAIMEIQSQVVTAKGKHFQRDGIDYIIVEDVIASDGITKLNHEDYGPVPPFSGLRRSEVNHESENYIIDPHCRRDLNDRRFRYRFLRG